MGVLVLHSSADSIRALDHRADITKWDVMAGDLPPRLNERNIYSLTLPDDPFTSHCRGGLNAKWRSRVGSGLATGRRSSARRVRRATSYLVRTAGRRVSAVPKDVA